MLLRLLVAAAGASKTLHRCVACRGVRLVEHSQSSQEGKRLTPLLAECLVFFASLLSLLTPSHFAFCPP